ncbi:MAG TPA: ATP-binding protein [Puia sp.]|nr:ATP-binding protein [Puia sp.]
MRFKRKRLAVATAAYWFLLAYIIAGLAWWFIALETTNRQLARNQLEQLRRDDPAFETRRSAILAEEKRQSAAYIGEGSTFLFIILLGGLFVYREVRHQIRFQQQQQNFMMAVTHELKTPIAVTKLNLETLRKYRLEEEKQQRIILATIQETNRLDTLANNILVASQLEGGGYARTKEVVDLSGLADRLVRDFRNRFPDREWESQVQPDCTISGDPFLLQLLVSNLLENALKYSPKEAPVRLSLERRERHILLAVSDRGPGIPDEEKKKVFAKFYRSGQEATRQTKGTGLGLYLCRKIAADHRAAIRVADNSPSGSIFTVEF